MAPRARSTPKMHSEQRTIAKRSAEDLHNLADRENRSLTPAESTRFDALIARVAELDEQETRENRAAAHRVQTGTTGQYFTNDPQIYNDPHQAGADSPSFFRDVRNARMGDYQAAERLQRNSQARGMETRAGDMTT